MKSKVIVLLLIVAMATVAFAGGSAEEPEETPTVEYLMFHNVSTEGFDLNDNHYLDYIEEQNDVDITLINAGGYSELLARINTMLASGDPPDYMQIPFRERALFTSLANEGFLLELDEERINEWENLRDAFKPISWELSKVNGTIYGVPYQRFDPTPMMMFARTDWLENLDIDPDGIRTIDDWYEMMRAFTHDDPDGNGVDDTFGYFGQGDVIVLWTWALAPAFGAGQTRMIDGEIHPPYIQPEWAEWLKFMNRLYEEGILDPDFVTSNNQDQQEKAAGGKYGAWLFFWHLTEQLGRGIPRETWTPIAPPLGPDGEQSQYLYAGPLRQWIGISADSEHPDKVLQILDWGLSQEGGRFAQAGLPDIDYDIVNGEVVIREDRLGVSWAWRSANLGLQRSRLDGEYGELVGQVYGQLGTQWLEWSNEWGGYDEIGILLPAFPETFDYDLQAQADEFVYQAILGQVDVDAEFDNWVAQWRNSGGDIWIEKATEYYLENLR